MEGPKYFHLILRPCKIKPYLIGRKIIKSIVMKKAKEVKVLGGVCP